MTWTYTAAPSTTTPEGRRDAVRVLIGDTDTTDQQITDEVIAFALDQSGDEVYEAGAIIARSLAAKYARLVDTKVEDVETKYSQRRDTYMQLARDLEAQAEKYGSSSLGVPIAGGISISEMEAARDDTDRVPALFKVGQFDNPTFSKDLPDELGGYR
jgi:hypothetical protein